MRVDSNQERLSPLLDVVARTIIFITVLIGIVYPWGVLVLSALAPATLASGAQVLEAVAWSTLDSALVAFVTSTVAAFVVAIVRSLPRRMSMVFDGAFLLPATVSPFVISGALGRGFGRGGIFAPSGMPPFLGHFALLISFGLALFPYAYALLRISVWNVPLALIDIGRVNGASEWAIFRNTVWPSLRRGIPFAWMVVFVLAISDPLVPMMVSYPHPNASHSVWILTTAIGDTSGAARISIALLIATLSVGLLTYRTVNSRDLFPTLQGVSNASSRVSFSQPVALALWPRMLISTLVCVIVILPIAVMFVTSRADLTATFPRVISTAVNISILTVIGSIIIAGSGLWLKARRPHSHLIDILFGLALLIPGAATGTALSLAYGPASTLAASLTPGARSMLSSLLMVIAYLTLSAPLTYVSVRAYGSVLPKQDFETALMLGASVARATRVATLTWLRQSVVISVTIVLAVSAVSVAPIMWVTSPSTPLLVPYLYRLVDHADFGTASTLALLVSGAILLLLLLTSLLLSVRTFRKSARL